MTGKQNQNLPPASMKITWLLSALFMTLSSGLALAQMEGPPAPDTPSTPAPIFQPMTPPAAEEGPPAPENGPPAPETAATEEEEEAVELPPMMGPPVPEPPKKTAPEVVEEPVEEEMPELLPAKETGPTTTGPGFVDAWQTTAGARILVLSIPAPRGQIVDRNGAPLAQNRVVHYLGIKFPFMDEPSDTEILTYARRQMSQANVTLNQAWDLDDEDIIAHYRDRRWLPLIFSRMPLSEEQVDQIEVLNAEGLELQPTYQRFYPQGSTAGHIIGFVGKRGPWAIGEIPDGEAMWPTAEGVQGLELQYDEQLTGMSGRVQIIFDENGKQVQKTVIRAPVPGNNVVTTLDLEMQKLAEETCAAKMKRGAFVIMDCRNGDILAMASYPNFDPNEYVPRISTTRLQELMNDPAKPLYGRAFQGVYPPASTFKLAAGLGILESGAVDEYTIYGCPTSFTLGNRVAHNWAKVDEGSMNIIGAITRSCNTWFYQAGIQARTPSITLAGQKLGYGEKTGVLPGESSGNMPTNEWHRKVFGYPILDGDLMNIVIGQGSVEATPLQTCQAMAAIGNRQFLMKARLVTQIQDYANGIVQGFAPDQVPLNFSQHNIAVIHKGMYDVVNAGNGTGKAAGHSRVSFSGKTGTGQWKEINGVDQNLAWFSGFAPSEYPVYAYAALYEGDPGEAVSGGRCGAPVIGEFFKTYLTDERLAALQEVSDEIRIATEDMVVETEELGTGGIYGGAPPTGEETEPVRAKKPKKNNGGGGGFFKKLFNN